MRARPPMCADEHRASLHRGKTTGGFFMRLINIGFGNLVAAERVVALVSPESAPIKRLVQEARERGGLIDASFGRRTKSVLVTDSGHTVLSALPPETLSARLNGTEEGENEI